MSQPRYKGKFCRVPDGYVKLADTPQTTRTIHHYEPSADHYHWGWMILTFGLGALGGLILGSIL
ncbi:MAG: hypothetical protein KGL39_50435 [Patescibacteria group bacterium]|nr:hypothetical protein [Patescibacteria group bacterium]